MLGKSRVAAAAMLGLLAIAPVCAGEAEIGRFLREYPEAGRKLQAAYSRIKGSYLLTRRPHLPPGNTTVLVSTIAFACDHGAEKVVDEKPSEESGPVEVVQLSDGKRTSVLLRPAGAWEYTLQGTRDGLAAPGIACRKRLDVFLAAPYSVEGLPLADLMREPTFRVKSAEPVEIDGRPCLEVDYEVGPVKSEATVTLDPGACWAIRRAEIRQGSSPRTHFTYAVEYEPGSEAGGPARAIAVDHNAPFDSRDRCEFRTIAFEGTPAEEFTLARYGLSASSPARGLPTRWESIRPWLDGAVVLGAIAAVALFLRRRASG